MTGIFNYRANRLVRNIMLGGHKSIQRGTGTDFYKTSLFLSEPNLSAMDLNRSMTDPFEQIHVRSYRQRSKIDVVLLIDASSSMTLDMKPQVIEQLFCSIKSSVEVAEDDFHCYLFGKEAMNIDSTETLNIALTHCARNNAPSFKRAIEIMPKRTCLVFVVSDFHWSELRLHQVMTALSQHTVVPIVLWQSAEYESYPLWRFVELADLETGQPSLVFVTPRQKQRIQRAYKQRKSYLNEMLLNYQARAFWLVDKYFPDQMNHYFSA